MSQLSGDPVWWCFDPGVVVDDDGVGWIAFGGGDPHADDPDENAMDTGNCRIARLSDDMLSIEGEVTEIHAPYHFEANELNYINGTWVLTYCSNYSERMIWPSDAELPAPSGGSMCYMTSTDPLNSDSWVYKGEYCTNPNTQGYPFSNNHTHLQSTATSTTCFTRTYLFLRTWARPLPDSEVSESISAMSMNLQLPSALSR